MISVPTYADFTLLIVRPYTPVVCADLTENFGPWRHHACSVLADISQAEAVRLFQFKTDTISIYFFHYRNFHQYYSRCNLRVLCMTFCTYDFYQIKVVYSEFIRHNRLLCNIRVVLPPYVVRLSVHPSVPSLGPSFKPRPHIGPRQHNPTPKPPLTLAVITSSSPVSANSGLLIPESHPHRVSITDFNHGFMSHYHVRACFTTSSLLPAYFGPCL